MKQTNYMQTISKANTLEELAQIKESFAFFIFVKNYSGL